MSNDKKLHRSLGMVEMVAIASGAVIGGWLAEAPYWFSVTGAGAAFIFPILSILLIPIGLAFSELTAMLPFTSSVGVWTNNAFGPTFGWIAQWLIFLIQVVEPPMMAFIFITALNYFIPIPSNMVIWVAIAIIVLWYIISNFDISITGKLSTIFFFSMIIISLVVSVSFYTSGNWEVANLKIDGGIFPMGFRGIFVALGVFSLKFIGFEMTPTLIQETNFPVKNIWKVILSALFVPAILYLIVVLAMGGMASWSDLANMSMPEPEIVAMYSLPKIIGYAAILSGILHAFTTLMGFWTSSARVLFGAAQLNQLPAVFKKLNHHGQPYIANIIVLVFSVFFSFFTGDNWVQDIYAISSVAAGGLYIIVSLDALQLRKLHPEWERPYKAPGGNGVFVLGAVIGLAILVASMLELTTSSYIALAIYIVVGLILKIIMDSFRKKDPNNLGVVTLTPADRDDHEYQ